MARRCLWICVTAFFGKSLRARTSKFQSSPSERKGPRVAGLLWFLNCLTIHTFNKGESSDYHHRPIPSAIEKAIMVALLLRYWTLSTSFRGGKFGHSCERNQIQQTRYSVHRLRKIVLSDQNNRDMIALTSTSHKPSTVCSTLQFPLGNIRIVWKSISLKVSLEILGGSWR